MRVLNILLGLLVLLLQPVAPSAAAPHGHGHSGGQGTVALDLYQDGSHLHLLTAEIAPGEATHALWHQASADGGKTWSGKVRVDAGQPPPQGATRGNDPQIAAHDEHLVAVWMTKGTGLFDSGPMATAISRDGGKTWSRGANPADDGTTGGHGFIDIAADPAGRFHLAWLDSRDGGPGLRYARSPDAGDTWLPNETIDARTCECCWNDMVISPQGPCILYRDKEPRDMRLAVLGSERSNTPVGAFGWNFDGCPHLGGALAVTGTGATATVHAAVWTGEANAAGLYYLRSSNSGQKWINPVRMGAENAWHPALAADAKGQLALAWDTKPEEGMAEIWVSLSSDDGSTWDAPRRVSSPGARASHPAIAPTADGFRIFWTQTAEDSAVSTWESAVVPRSLY